MIYKKIIFKYRVIYVDKLKRNERIAGIMYILTTNPNKVFTYGYFSKLFKVKKPSISGDISIMKELVVKLDIGHIETIPGANGGVRFSPNMRKKDVENLLLEICAELSKDERLIPGGFIYMMDILYTPRIIKNIGKIFANEFVKNDIDYVVTIETKGIPIALMTAEILNVPLIIIRKNMKITEGPAVNINYLSGSNKTIQTMSLSKRAIKEGSKVLIIDDFMRAGGTVKGMKEMMREFNAEVAGVGIFISTKNPEKKLVEDYVSLIRLEKIDEEKNEIILIPNFKQLKQFR